MDTYSSINFYVLALLLLLLERFSSLRRSTAPVQHRWGTNIGLMVLLGVLAPIVFPTTVAQVASTLEDGMVSNLPLPFFVEAALLFLFLDCWRYWEHRVFHEVPLFWRAHLVHHSDTAIDVTTAQRHHPFETIVAMLLSFMLVFALGLSAEALGIYLFVSMLSSAFTHANISLPASIDRSLRRWLVTPAVHAVHHSSHQPETDSNYGAVLTIWDRLFGTYTSPGAGLPARFGLEYFRGAQGDLLLSVLLQPFAYRRDGLYPEAENPMPVQVAAGQPKPAWSTAWRRALLYGGIGLALALLALWPTVLDLAVLWTQTSSYQYAWLVLPMFFYVVGWYHRDSLLALTPRPGSAGMPLLLAAAALWLVAFNGDFKLGQHLALVLVLQGVALCSLGAATYRKLLPAMLLLFLMIPCGDIVQPLLRNLTVKWLEWFAILGGLPHSIDGYFISFGEHDYVVLESCSGLAFFTLAGFLGYSFGLLLFRSLPKVLAMAALGALLGILTNAVRVCLIVAIDWLNGTQMDLAAHKDIQWVALALALGALLLLASRLEHDAWPAPAAA